MGICAEAVVGLSKRFLLHVVITGLPPPTNQAKLVWDLMPTIKERWGNVVWPDGIVIPSELVSEYNKDPANPPLCITPLLSTNLLTIIILAKDKPPFSVEDTITALAAQNIKTLAFSIRSNVCCLAVGK